MDDSVRPYLRRSSSSILYPQASTNILPNSTKKYADFREDTVIFILSSTEQYSRGAFSLSVAFDEGTAHDAFHKGMYFGIERSATGCHDSNAPSEAFPYLFEYNRIVKSTGIGSVWESVFQFRLYPVIYDTFFYSRLGSELLLYPLNDPIVQSRNRNKNGWLDDLAIILQLEDISAGDSKYLKDYTKNPP